MEKFNEILKFIMGKSTKTAVLAFLLACFMMVFAFVKWVYPFFQSWQSLNEDIIKQETTYKELVEQHKARQLEEQRSLVKIEKVPVTIYKTVTEGLPIESASIDFVTNVIGMLEKTDNSILDISYKIDGLTQIEKDSLPASVSVVQLVMTLNSTYSSFQNFINTLYDYSYLATIKSVKMTPLKENKNMLEVNIVIWLYVSK